MKLSELKDGEASLVQSGASDAPLKLSEIDPDGAELVQRAPGAARSALDHFANSAALGYLPQLQGASERTMDRIGDLVTGNDTTGESTLGKIVGIAKLASPIGAIAEMVSSAKSPDYLKSRDEAVSRLDQESDAHPYASKAGTVAGALAGGAALSPLTPINGATMAARAIQGAKIGALYGAASNPGDTEGRLGGAQLIDRTGNAFVGGAIGGISTPVIETAVNGLLAAKNKLANYAAEKAAKAIGMTKADYKRIGPDGAKALGQAALEQNIVTPLATPEKIAAKTDAMKEVAGQKIGQIIDGAQQQLDQMPAAGMMPAGESVSASPIKTEVQYPVGEKVVPAGADGEFLTPIQPRPAGRINAPALAKQLRGQGDLSKLSKIPGMEGLAGKISGFLDTLERNPQDMTLRDAQELRQGIDSAVNWGKRVPDMAGTQQYLVEIRNALSDAMSGAVDKAASESGGAVGALRQANKQYSTLAKINDIASNRAAMNAANRAVGLTDTIAGGAGAGVGATIGNAVAGPYGAEIGAGAGSVAGGAINKFGRTFGPALAARTAYRGAQAAGASSGLGSIMMQNPAVAQMLLQSQMRKNGEAPSVTQRPMLGENDTQDRAPAAKDPKIQGYAKTHGLTYDMAEAILRKRGYGR